MSRGARAALILTAILLFLCCVGGLGLTLLGTRLIGRVFITNPDRVRAVGQQIADYDVPADYEEMLAMNVMGIKMVAIGSTTPSPSFMMIVLMQFPRGLGVTQEEMERQIEQAMARQGGLGDADMTIVWQEETTIKGEPVTLTVREGTTGGGEHLRQMSGLFPGKGGPAMVMVIGETAVWDQPAVDLFIASIR